MDFLADESFDFRLVRALQAAGHNVLAVAEQALGADDSVVMQLASDGNRVLLTEDKDFGWLVYVSKRQRAESFSCAARSGAGRASPQSCLA